MESTFVLTTRALAERAIPRILARFVSRSIVLVAACAMLSAHVGTDIVVLEGQAGAYPLRVIIRPQGVVPAQVPIVIRVLHGTPTRVTVRAAQWNVGTKGAPPAEVAAIVPGEPGTYARDLWIMTSSAYAVHVAVEGAEGSGELVVPMQSVATRTLAMPQLTGGVLVVLATLLVVGVLTIVGAASREATLAAGVAVDGVRKRASRVSVGIATAVIAVALVGGARWWQSAESSYKTGLYKPYHVVANVGGNATNTLKLRVDDPAWTSRRNTPLMPDHGKLMHLFLVRANDAGVIAHLHPIRTAFDEFESWLPSIPAGRYFLFADVVHESGFQRTLVDTVTVPVRSVDHALQPADPKAPTPQLAVTTDRSRASTGVTNVIAPATQVADSDDAWRVVAPVNVGDGALLTSGGTMTLTADAPLVAGNDLRLQIAVKNGDGTPSRLQPYMGMGGHAMVMRTDGGVFVHLHPAGTASMAAQSALVRREAGDSLPTDSASMAARSSMPKVPDMAPMMEAHDTIQGTIAFPFAFPTPGLYRVFVQVKRNGAIETGAFKVVVK